MSTKIFLRRRTINFLTPCNAMRGDFFLFFHGHIVADIGRKEKPCFLFFAAAYTGMSAMLNAKKEETHLEKNDTAVKICGTTEGRLPGSCAPLAFPYVPVQCDNPARYSQQDALQAGTLFPGLNLPFHADLETRFPAANTALSELMALDFAIDELGLYLTTHRDDQEVLALYWSYIKLAREGREKYQEKYGPLLQTDLTPGSYKWLDNPWPWDLGGND